MKKIVFTFLAITTMLSFGSCTVARISGKGAVPILLNQPAEKMELVEHIKIKKNSNFDYTSSFDASQLLATEIAAKKPDAVANVTVVVKSGFDNFLINLFTLTLAQSRKVVIEADLLKEKEK